MDPVASPSDSNLILAAVLASSDDAIVVIDLDGIVCSWNRGAERMYGHSSAEMVGSPLSAIVPSDRTGEIDRILAALRAGEPVEAFDTVRMTRGGVRFPVSLSAAPIRAAGGESVGAVVTTRDITAQRQAERALGRSEARWGAVIETAVDAIILINRHGRVESFNPAASRMFGYAADEVIGRNVSMLMPEPYASEHDHYLRRYQMTGERRIIGIGREVVGRRKDGTTFPAHLSVGELAIEGERMFSGIVRDLTERVSLEHRLRDESGLVRIGELAAVLAHEVKNPLAAVSGAIQMLGDHLSADEDREIVQEILRRLDGLGALMSDLLLYARPPRLRVGTVDVMELLRSLVSFFGSDPSWKALRVVVDGAVPPLQADPELLKVVFQNLLLNAAQAMQGRGEISIRLRTIDRYAHVDIRDHGPGIPPEVREKLFTPFFTTKARGTGLGLATVRRLAESHLGHVEILESGSEGTTVRVTLPVGRPQSALA
jgi:PAS domain S-box-containing protein